MRDSPKRLFDILLNPRALWALLREYFTVKPWQRHTPVDSQARLEEFLNTRASYVAQVSLYGYLRTRAGMRYPELFDDDPFVVSINIAKWQIWLACLSDLAIYAGGLLMQHPQADSDRVTTLIKNAVDTILNTTGVPTDAGSEFTQTAEHIRQRVATCDWATVTDDEAPFSESPDALVKWSPIVDDLKQLDEEIVRNSIRFRWQKVRRDLRSLLQSATLLGINTQPDTKL